MGGTTASAYPVMSCCTVPANIRGQLALSTQPWEKLACTARCAYGQMACIVVISSLQPSREPKNLGQWLPMNRPPCKPSGNTPSAFESKNYFSTVSQGCLS